MGILSDRDIAESLLTGYIGISGYSERGLTPNGYDLRIAEIAVRGDPEVKREGVVTIPPRTMFYVSTVERVRMPDDICAQLWLRTTWIRKGIIGAFGKIDAGFEGTLTLGAYNATDDPVELPIGERFCQMVFETLNSESDRNYSLRSGNYQGQTGVTLDPLKKRGSGSASRQRVPYRFRLAKEPLRKGARDILVLGLGEDPELRLRAGRAHQHPAVVEVDPDPVGQVHLVPAVHPGDAVNHRFLGGVFASHGRLDGVETRKRGDLVLQGAFQGDRLQHPRYCHGAITAVLMVCEYHSAVLLPPTTAPSDIILRATTGDPTAV